MALAIRSMQLNNRKHTLWFLAATLVFAATFLVIKYFEYEHKIHLGQLPGKYYTYTGSARATTRTSSSASISR